jgi:hypothetical protein
LKLGKEGHVVCERELMLAKGRGLESPVRLIVFPISLFGFVIGHPIGGLKIGKELGIVFFSFSPTSVP